MAETMQPVECGACGWRSRRKTGNVVICPKCGAVAGFDVPAAAHEYPAPAARSPAPRNRSTETGTQY